MHLKLTSPNQGVIESIAERKTLLYRSDQYKSKLLAANVTQLFIVVATEPGFSDDLVSRALVAAEAAGIEAHIMLNKIDVDRTAAERARERLAPYTSARLSACMKCRRAAAPEAGGRHAAAAAARPVDAS